MAQAVKFNSAQVLKNVGVQLPDVKDQKVTVYGKDLWKADPAAWKNLGNIALFRGGNPLNSGTVDVTKLDRSRMYEVFYVLSMNDHEVKSTVKLTLELPNKIIYEKIVDLTVEPLQRQEVSVGKFLNIFSAGNIRFSFSGDIGDTWKGLLIEEVLTTSI